MKTSIEELKIEILALKTKLNTYDKLHVSSERLKELIKTRVEELSEIDIIILHNKDILSKQQIKLDNNNISIENTTNTIANLTCKLSKLEKGITASNKNIGSLERQIIDKEDRNTELQALLNKKKEEIEEYKIKKTKELEEELNVIKNNVYIETNTIIKLKEDKLLADRAYIDASSTMKEQNIKIQTNNTLLYDLEKEREVLQAKIVALKNEIALMLKEGKEIATDLKVVKSRATRLDRINNNFIN